MNEHGSVAAQALLHNVMMWLATAQVHDKKMVLRDENSDSHQTQQADAHTLFSACCTPTNTLDSLHLRLVDAW